MGTQFCFAFLRHKALKLLHIIDLFALDAVLISLLMPAPQPNLKPFW